MCQNKPGFRIIAVNGGFLHIVTVQEDSWNSHMSARYYSTPSTASKKYTEHIKVTPFTSEYRYCPSLIVKQISIAIVCDKLRLKWFEDTLRVDKSDNHNLYGWKGSTGVDEL